MLPCRLASLLFTCVFSWFPNFPATIHTLVTHFLSRAEMCSQRMGESFTQWAETYAACIEWICLWSHARMKWSSAKYKCDMKCPLQEANRCVARVYHSRIHERDAMLIHVCDSLFLCAHVRSPEISTVQVVKTCCIFDSTKYRMQEHGTHAQHIYGSLSLFPSMRIDADPRAFSPSTSKRVALYTRL